jgi:hypothetical protein
MKRITLIFVVWIAVTVIASAAWILGYFPPLSLPAAYSFATESLGSLTNDFKCVEAKRDKRMSVWDFTFESTNASVKDIIVFDYLADNNPTNRVLIRDVPK